MRNEENIALSQEMKHNLPSQDELDEDEMHMQDIVAAATDRRHPDYAKYDVRVDPTNGMVHIYRLSDTADVLVLSSEEFEERKRKNREMLLTRIASEIAGGPDDIQPTFKPQQSKWH